MIPAAMMRRSHKRISFFVYDIVDELW
jgi:hypothetical protein